MTAELHWFPVFVADWLTSDAITLMLPEQEGAFFRLLLRAWGKGVNEPSLDADDATLATLSRLGRRWAKLGVLVREQFEERDGRLYNLKLSDVWAEQQLKHGSAVERGKLGARARIANLKPSSSSAQAQLKQLELEREREEAKATTPVATAPGRKARAKRPSAPWMSRVESAWAYGTLPPGSATLLTPVVAAVGEEETAARLSEYCVAVESRYASVRDFVAKHATYAERLGVDPKTGTLNATGMQALGLGGRR